MSELAQYPPDFGPRPDGASTFIQWKGTVVCMDFACECGHHAHICDEDFVYSVRCHACGRTWLMPHTVALKPAPEGWGGCVVDTP